MLESKLTLPTEGPNPPPLFLSLPMAFDRSQAEDIQLGKPQQSHVHNFPHVSGVQKSEHSSNASKHPCAAMILIPTPEFDQVAALLTQNISPTLFDQIWPRRSQAKSLPIPRSTALIGTSDFFFLKYANKK